MTRQQTHLSQRAAEAPHCAGLILAGGRSSRMGSPKALLQSSESPATSLLELAVRALAQGTQRVGCVVHDEQTHQRAVELGLLVAVQGEPERGMVHSAALGLAAFERSQPVDVLVLLPVDGPIRQSTLAAELVDAVWKSGAAAAYPTWRGRAGHPLALAGEALQRLRSERLPSTLRDCYAGLTVAPLATDCGDVVLNLNTRDDWDRWRRTAAQDSQAGADKSTLMSVPRETT